MSGQKRYQHLCSEFVDQTIDIANTQNQLSPKTQTTPSIYQNRQVETQTPTPTSPIVVVINMNTPEKPSLTQMPLEEPSKLSKREQDVLVGIASGHANKRIAHNLGLSTRTVETYRRNLMKKLDLHSTADLTKYAIKTGLINLDENM